MSVRELRDTAIEIVGRAWSLNSDSASNTYSRHWTMARTATDEIPTPAEAGLPAVGSNLIIGGEVYPLKLTSYAVTENSDGSINYDAEYSVPVSDAASTGGGGKPDPSDPAVPVKLESASWSGVRYPVDLTKDAKTGKAVILPTDEPFESVPQTWLRGRQYEEVYLCKAIPAGLLESSDTVNQNAEFTVGGITFQARCGMLTASAERLLDNPDYSYRVTVTVEIRHNFVQLVPPGGGAGAGDPVDIGHDTALLLQGFRYFDINGKLQTAMEPDGKGGQRPSSVPVFLDEAGMKVDPGPNKLAYFMRVHVAPESEWKKSWFVDVGLPPANPEKPKQQ